MQASWVEPRPHLTTMGHIGMGYGFITIGLPCSAL